MLRYYYIAATLLRAMIALPLCHATPLCHAAAYAFCYADATLPLYAALMPAYATLLPATPCCHDAI